MRGASKWLVIVVLALGALGLVSGHTPDTDVADMRAKYTNESSRFIEVEPGLVLHVRDEGNRDGSVLLLLHGSNASLQTWEPWTESLGEKYRVVTLDLPGHGLTGPDPGRDYRYARYTQVVESAVRKLELERFAIGGNSMGGGVAWNYALAHPDKLTALILVSTSGMPDWQAKKAPIGFRIARMPVVRDIAELITPRRMIESSLDTSIGKKAILDDAMVDRYWELLRFPGNRRATLDRFSIEHNSEPASEEKMARLTLPTLILWGEEDDLIPVESAEWFHEHIPDSELRTYAHVGHILMEEVPRRSAADVDAFLSALIDPSNDRP